MQPDQSGFQPQQSATPVAQPTYQPDVAAPQVVTNTAPAPNVQPGVTTAVVQPAPTKGGSKKFVIIAVVAIVLLLGLTAAAVVLGGSKPATKKAASTTATQSTGGPAAASATSLQQDSDAISQNMSGVDDTADFPSNALDDNTLSSR